MISPPFDFNVRVKMFIIIMLIFSFFACLFDLFGYVALVVVVV